jgi:hypothetical protein
VDPVSGLLRVNAQRAKARRAWRQERGTDGQPAADRCDLDPFLQLHRLKGNWYEVDLAPIPMPSGGTAVFDVVRCRQVVHWRQQGAGKKFVHGDAALYGRDDVYAWRKRQLGARDLRRHGLANATE